MDPSNDAGFHSLRRELAEDLALLRREIGSIQTMPAPAVLRGVIAPLLRKWVSDNGLKPIHDVNQFQSKYMVQNTGAMVNLCKRGFFENWYCLVPVEGVEIGGARPKDPRAPPIPQPEEREIVYDFKSFRSQKIAYCGSRFMTREQCVRFAADRMGGTHTQAQAKPRPHDPVEFLTLSGAALIPNQGVQIMGTAEFDKIEEYRSEGRLVYSLMHLTVLDTARRFCSGVESSGLLV